MASRIRITIEIDNTKYILPVLPPSLQITYPSGNETAEVIKLGEITIQKTRKLKTTTIDSFLPRRANDYPFCITRDKFMVPEKYISAFERAQNEKIPCIVTIEASGLPAFWATIEDFSITIDRNDDIGYSLNIKEYRPYGQRAKTMQINTNTLFAGTVMSWDKQGSKRQPKAFAPGDIVLVNGAYWATPTGLYPPAEGLLNFGAEPLTAPLRELWRNRKNQSGNKLSEQRCIIVDIEADRTMTPDLPVIGQVGFPLPIPFRYAVADATDGKMYGWVAEKQMTRVQ